MQKINAKEIMQKGWLKIKADPERFAIDCFVSIIFMASTVGFAYVLNASHYTRFFISLIGGFYAAYFMFERINYFNKARKERKQKELAEAQVQS